MSEPTHAVGIDLGTTHCALSIIDLELSEGEEVAQSTLAIPQITAPGEIEARPLLPSFLYLPHESELPEHAYTLPWADHPKTLLVGEGARALGTKSALRLVSSAKSWLCHPAVDRRAPILPAGAPAEVPKVSPLEASVRYLEHLTQAYNRAHPDTPLAEQVVTITVPASFDPVARELTAEAARLAGLEHAVLLEEPQAALYSWLSASRGGWRKQVKVGDVILVVDVGGGTSDFSLISVQESEGQLELSRVAVGEHILLGGDNMDLALAHYLQGGLNESGHKLEPVQFATLVQGARAAKERLLTVTSEDSAPVVIPGKGSRLVGGTLRTELRRESLEQLLIEGFFPLVEVTARPAVRTRAGFTQLGLPYAQDAAITKHLAAFLTRQASALHHEGFAKPSWVLFNGGVFKSELLQQRVLGALNGWLTGAGASAAQPLAGADLDLAVARGAAYYGYVRKGRGIRIRGGTAMSYYVGVESAVPAVPGLPTPIQALCVAPFGLEEGTHAAMPTVELGLIVGEPVRFRFFGSSVRRDDPAGQLLERFTSEELEELSEIEVTLGADGYEPGEVVTVQLQAGITDVGTLELEAVAVERGVRWRVALDTRAQS